MAYILQHRRDTLANWNAVNPVLADAEIGYILDLDDQGKQKSSLYKIGDGRTAWKDLPLFGFGGNVYDNFSGSDLSTSVASRQAILNKIDEKILAATGDTDVKITDVLDALEDKADKSQIVQEFWPVKMEQFGDLIYNPNPATDENGNVIEPGEPLTWEQMEPYMRQQVVSRYESIIQLQETWNDFGRMEDRQNAFDNSLETFKNDTETQLETLQGNIQSTTDAFNEFKPATETSISEINASLEAHASSIDSHDKFINGWDEEVGVGEDDQPIITHHDSVDEKLANVDEKIENLKREFDSKHNILTTSQFREIRDFSGFAEGALFFTYEESGN